MTYDYYDAFKLRNRNYSFSSGLRTTDWMDIFVMRYQYAFYVIVNDPEINRPSVQWTVENAFFNGHCNKLIITGNETVLQYFRTNREKDSEYLWRIDVPTVLTNYLPYPSLYHFTKDSFSF
ncbi:unnamed protein product [Toxocara canis]|uniref:Structural protein n=1 Tax=Toxocara canis TaxID=6265 RepID=A0A183V3G5_TOXCA|nr:unnamed protein product [Toxocara canis]